MFRLWPTATHSEIGEVRINGQPVHFSETDWQLCAARGELCLGEPQRAGANQAPCFGSRENDRKMLDLSIDLKSTPPFPGGHEIEEGDWSLLDPVKARAPFYRRVEKA